MSAKGDANGWDRVNFNVRLSKARRAQLKALAAGLPPTATPVEALDRALGLALQPRDGGVSDERMDELEDLISALAMKNEIDFGHLGERLGAVTHAMEDLRALISAVAESEGEAASSQQREVPLAFRDWMAGELAARRIQAPAEAVVRVVWRATTAKSQRVVAMDFDATLISVDGKLARVAAAGLAGVRFEVDSASDFAAAWRQGPLTLRCEAQAMGWRLHASLAGQDGSPSRSVAKFDI